jgi:hypothetical protein
LQQRLGAAVELAGIELDLQAHTVETELLRGGGAGLRAEKKAGCE